MDSGSIRSAKVRLVKEAVHAIDIQRSMDAPTIEGRFRTRLLRLSGDLKVIYDSDGRPTEDEVKKLRRSIRRWIKTAKMVANVIDEQIPARAGRLRKHLWLTDPATPPSDEPMDSGDIRPA